MFEKTGKLDAKSELITTQKFFERSIYKASDFRQSRKYDQYRLPLSIVKGQTNELTVYLRNQQGHVRMCIKASYEDLDPNKTCIEQFGELADEFFHFTTEDPRFSQTPELRIRVEPVFKDQSELQQFNEEDLAKKPEGESAPKKVWFGYTIWLGETKGVHKLYNGVSYYGNI